jgi:mRNA interferase RelE/StbE
MNQAFTPRARGSFPYGSPDLRRLRAGRYCVFYTIDEVRQIVEIDHVARLPWPRHSWPNRR